MWGRVSPSESKWNLIINESKWDQVASSGPKWVQVSPSEIKWDKVSPSESKWDQVSPSETKWVQESSSETRPLPPILLSSFSWPYRYIYIYIYMHLHIYYKYALGCINSREFALVVNLEGSKIVLTVADPLHSGVFSLFRSFATFTQIPQRFSMDACSVQRLRS